MESALASAIHLLGLALGVTALVLRDRALSAPQFDAAARDRVLAGDNWNGIAAIMLFGAGFWRLLGGLQKPTVWYMHDYGFMAKMTVLGIVMSLEMFPMYTFIKWRVRIAKKLEVDTRRVPLLRLLNRLEIAGMVIVVILASIMARGLYHKKASTAGCAVEDTVTAKCLTCHGTTAPQGGMVLQGDFHGTVVNVPSSQWKDQIRVVPGDPQASLLWRKVSGTQAPQHGLSMPMGQPLDAALAAEIEAWIKAGAPKCGR